MKSDIVSCFRPITPPFLNMASFLSHAKAALHEAFACKVTVTTQFCNPEEGVLEATWKVGGNTQQQARQRVVRSFSRDVEMYTKLGGRESK